MPDSAMREASAAFVLRKQMREMRVLHTAELKSLLGRAPPKPAQRLIFTVSNGRSATQMLSTIFTAFRDTIAVHEIQPDFRHLRGLAARWPGLAKRWMKHVKLPAIAALPGRTYVDTSHMFGKGFVEPTLELGQDFDLMVLTRSPRQIARSMVQLPSVPGRSRWSRSFYVSPDEPNFLPLKSFMSLSDYQVCYWHALENEARQRHYADRLAALGRRVAWIDASELNDRHAVLRFFVTLGMRMDQLDEAVLDERLTRRVNLKAHEKRGDKPDLVKLDEQEREVRERCVLPA